jgi:hypothetical protein
MAMARTWVMATATRVAGDKEGKSDGGNSDGIAAKTVVDEQR